MWFGSIHLRYNTRKKVLDVKRKEWYLYLRKPRGNHIHILFDYAPDVRLIELINKIKSRTSRLARRDYPEEVKKYYWKRLF